MLIFSVDGFIADREGAFGWTVPNEEQFRFHIAQTRELGLVDELRMFRNPVVVGGGTPFLPPVTEDVRLPDRDQDVRLARDLRALRARPR